MTVRLGLHIDANEPSTPAWFDAVPTRSIKLGRAPAADLCIADPTVARLHAVIELSSQGAVLHALASVRVNGTAVTRHALSAGDVLELGQTRLQVQFATAPQVAEPKQQISAQQLQAEPEPAPAAGDRLVELRCFCGPALLSMWHFKKPAHITVGETPRSTVFLSSEGLPCDDFELLSYRDGAYTLTVAPAMTGELLMAGQSRTLPLDDAAEIVLTPDAQVVIHWGGVSLAMRFCAPVSVSPAPLWSGFDIPYINSLGAAFFLHLVAITTLLLCPLDVKALQIDTLNQQGRFASLLVHAPLPTQRAQQMAAVLQQRLPAPRVKPTPEASKPTAAHAAIAPPSKVGGWPAPKPTRDSGVQAMQEFLSQHGVDMGAPGHTDPMAFVHLATLPNSAMLPSARDLGTDVAPGLSTSRGLPSIVTRHGLDVAGNSGPILGGLRRREVDVITLDAPRVEGALSSDVIKSVIDAQRAQVRYCYEAELQRHQDLQGRVLMRWIIGATGDVSYVSVLESTVDNRALEACLVARIGGWRFPAPAGGGVVEVRYPFVFRAN